MPKVVKFGGSSLASAAQFQKAGEIIRSEKSRKYVIPSAPGKRNSRDTKITEKSSTGFPLLFLLRKSLNRSGSSLSRKQDGSTRPPEANT